MQSISVLNPPLASELFVNPRVQPLHVVPSSGKSRKDSKKNKVRKQGKTYSTEEMLKISAERPQERPSPKERKCGEGRNPHKRKRENTPSTINFRNKKLRKNDGGSSSRSSGQKKEKSFSEEITNTKKSAKLCAKDKKSDATDKASAKNSCTFEMRSEGEKEIVEIADDRKTSQMKEVVPEEEPQLSKEKPREERRRDFTRSVYGRNTEPTPKEEELKERRRQNRKDLQVLRETRKDRMAATGRMRAPPRPLPDYTLHQESESESSAEPPEPPRKVDAEETSDEHKRKSSEGLKGGTNDENKSGKTSQQGDNHPRDREAGARDERSPSPEGGERCGSPERSDRSRSVSRDSERSQGVARDSERDHAATSDGGYSTSSSAYSTRSTMEAREQLEWDIDGMSDERPALKQLDALMQEPIVWCPEEKETLEKYTESFARIGEINGTMVRIKDIDASDDALRDFTGYIAWYYMRVVSAVHHEMVERYQYMDDVLGSDGALDTHAFMRQLLWEKKLILRRVESTLGKRKGLRGTGKVNSMKELDIRELLNEVTRTTRKPVTYQWTQPRWGRKTVGTTRIIVHELENDWWARCLAKK